MPSPKKATPSHSVRPKNSNAPARPNTYARPIKPKEIAIFTRQLATMLGAGIPLLQALEVVGRGNPNSRLSHVLSTIQTQVKTGASLSAAFRMHPRYFDALYCNLVAAGETAGILDTLLDRLASYMEKMEAIKSKIKSALMYPIAIMATAFIVVSIIMIFVIPSFKEVFSSFGAELPAPTRFVIAMSEVFVQYWWVLLLSLFAGFYLFRRSLRTNKTTQLWVDHMLLRIPVFGTLIEKSCVARWTRTLSTMFAAGVPLVEALDSVGGAAGNRVYGDASVRIQKEVSIGSSLAAAMSAQGIFPTMVLQMTEIGEESGTIDTMLGKIAGFYEAEVEDMVAGISSLLEPVIIVFLGVLIGGIVIAMYLPIFKLGQVV